ncbi:CAF17-like 4Fe-4S cluster assembly/insertion protein YgfZ [Polaromonas naphthalenivorans]|uniref:Glycine cleavage T protein (Aminomethyl transferase) n=1 Tax=Polaromonas naphthalenivorans (strain CJ2) TaxID=365044 RepID=A1VNM7_POLNA|nr:folate-binding protein YgfZ [Polaromonas naphthalenivorans]ABM37255.1 glycine cleavage T protein (aminomethyl transferase) [Polaromonas naphthalenivorans CJ2]
MTLTSPTPPISGIVQLTHLGLIRAAGEDAVKFLQSQLTQDVALMDLTQAHLAAFCNAKGRMQASFILFKRSQEEVLLVCSRDILAATLKRLSMFVMRAKAKLSDASDEFSLYGVAGSAIESMAGSTRPAWTKADIGDANMVFLYPGAGQLRALWCAPAASPAPQAAGIDLETWNWLEVQSGIAMITQPIFEAFVPQMLNYESVGGVNFKKGCYPGQEIVARSQYRGTLKRRACLVHADAAPAVGQEVFHIKDAEQPCGLVAAAAANPAGGFDAIVSIQTSAAADAAEHAGEKRLTLGSSTGAALALLPLPYPLLADI